MFTTKSTSRPAPVTKPPSCHEMALLVISHGSEVCDGPNRQLIGQVEKLRKTDCFAKVQGAVLYGEPSVEAALSALGDTPVHIVPMFMCDGLFTQKIIPARIKELIHEKQDITFAKPVGLSEGLASVILDRIKSSLVSDGYLEQEVRVVLIGHGSTANNSSQRATDQQASRLRAISDFKSVDTTFLDQPPYFSNVLPNLQGPVYAIGMFAADGLHAGIDIPSQISKMSDKKETHYLGAIGNSPAMIDLLHKCCM